jgi:glycine cleavage system H protein
MSQVISGFRYSKEHEWVEVLNENRVRVGITEFAQEQLGDLVFVGLPELDRECFAGESIGTLESVKAVSDLFSPVSGRIVEVNHSLEDAPETINEDPYKKGWIVVIELSNPSELNDLLTAEQYSSFIEEEYR